MKEYQLVWKKEVIDSFGTLAEAEAMQKEYQLAFNDWNVKIKVQYI